MSPALTAVETLSSFSIPVIGGLSFLWQAFSEEAWQCAVMPVAPVAYQVILEPGIGQFCSFEPRRVHTRINSWGLLLVRKLTDRKRESVP